MMDTTTAMAKDFYIYGEPYIGLGAYQYSLEGNVEEEQRDNFESFEHYLLQERANGNQQYTAELLYCLKELQHMDFEDELIAQLYPSVKAFVAHKKAAINHFLTKWWNVDTDFYHDILDLTDAVDTQEPHQIIIQGNSGYIVGIEFYSEKMQESYWFDYMPTKRTYQDDDEFQLFIPKDKYEELMLDLYGIFED